MYVDIHAHLDDKAFSGTVDAVLAQAKQAGIKVVISNGTNQESNEHVRTLCEQYPLVRPAYGLYPTEPVDPLVDDVTLKWIHTEALHGKFPPVAIGEIGLDGVEPVTEEQRVRFRKCIALAQELRRPVIIHSRKAEQEVFAELEQLRPAIPIVMHCFGGSKKLVQEGVKRGYYFSIPCTITRAQQFQLMAELVPSSQLFTETDAPYLSPEKEVFPNEPANVARTVQEIAKIKKITPEECRQLLFMNFQRVFS